MATYEALPYELAKHTRPCPHCKRSGATPLASLWGLPMTFVECQHCGARGPIVVFERHFDERLKAHALLDAADRWGLRGRTMTAEDIGLATTHQEGKD